MFSELRKGMPRKTLSDDLHIAPLARRKRSWGDRILLEPVQFLLSIILHDVHRDLSILAQIIFLAINES